MKIRLIRHATVQMDYANHELLLDPMFAGKYTFRSLTVGASSSRNPLTDLPCKVSELESPELTLITHTHFDHLDKEATLSNIRKHPAACQPSDLKKLESYEFERLIPTNEKGISFNSIRIYRTPAIHGHAVLGRLMGTGSGYVLKSSGEPTLYITGDTIFGKHISQIVLEHQPDVIIANLGAARFNLGGPITLCAKDVIDLRKVSPKSRIIAVHMNAINHCRLDRKGLKMFLEERNLNTNVYIPADGEVLEV